VTTAHETSTAFSDEVIKEHDIFELSKQQEMKEMLGTYADGQVEMFQRVSPRLFLITLAKLMRIGNGRLGQDNTHVAKNQG